MKPLFVAASLALGLCGCSESPPVIQILSSQVPSAECSLDDDSASRAAGSLNLAYGQSYVLGLFVNSSYTNTPLEVNGAPLDPEPTTGGQGTAIVETVELSYETTPNVRIPDQTINYTASLNPGSEQNRLVLSLLTQESAEALLDAVSPGGEPVQVTVTIKLTGRYAAGSGSFESNDYVYTFRAFNQDQGIPACAPGTVAEPVAPCGSSGGQDGNYPTCI
ncbi:hypothetical protein D7Y13_10715 [Corallococcus praedator]|uniref:Lipoprotein n=1 Tax=Corallococcus praedator TaxID=2316724 RepID=A0ABX9QKS8_9BACT|nr:MULTISPECIES: hypothetical protein [Corallococcus]RKH16840.1 hypothetical protein D7X74_14255 [Corallococcus sp. CA047B]RKH33506.1 hypothetical protein D7X75_11855 [Corallococcus sp. CA031C]RKI11696.1 hypothetical protein D7Y13_10715 [Corallococcus praedator]